MHDEQRRLIAELRTFSVCHLIDALGNACPVETGIRPLDPSFRICGPALTVECAPGDNLTVHHALHIARPGDVLIVRGSPDCGVALWGELMSMSAQSKHLAGTIVDGSVRDPLEIKAVGYPVFCREINPRRATKENYGRMNVPVRIGGITIKPHEFVVADANGILSLPGDRLKQAIELASEVANKESRIKLEILGGRSIFDIFNLAPFVTTNQQ